VAEIAARIGARGHATFGGHLAPDASGFVEHLMIRGGRTGDWRNFDRIEVWADAVAAELAREGVVGAADREPMAGAVR
jgi:menaquinone-dependent protoporphyrinogen oxidase